MPSHSRAPVQEFNVRILRVVVSPNSQRFGLTWCLGLYVVFRDEGVKDFALQIFVDALAEGFLIARRVTAEGETKYF